jgi:leucyl/phenylalanyl-tRNA--protein transferase
MELLLAKYRAGYFPMADSADGAVYWDTTDRRAVIPLDQFHIPRGLRRALKHPRFTVTFDTEFGEVIRQCATVHGATWISREIMAVYGELHRHGHAHSVETRWQGRLVGGLYGLQLGGAFFGESMFHHETDASKVALVALVDRLRQRGFTLLDVQRPTRHLAQFGTQTISKREFLQRLETAAALPCEF